MTDGKTTQAAQSYFERQKQIALDAMRKLRDRRQQIANDVHDLIQSGEIDNNMTVSALVNHLWAGATDLVIEINPRRESVTS